jgi:hypothetical protein
MARQTLKKSQVPEIVKGKFWFNIPETQDTIKFPVTWEKEGTFFKGSVFISDFTATLVYDSLGNLQKQVRKVMLPNLPKKISESLAKTYPECEPKLVLRITDKDGKETYQISMEIIDFYTAEGVKTTGKKENTNPKKPNAKKK